MTSYEQSILAAKALSGKKGLDIQVIEISDVSVLADYMVIATGTSTTHVKALADEVEYKLSEAGYEPHHIEGKATGWVCLDYTGVVIHVLYKDQRDFYQLERLWEDGEKVDIDEYITKE